MPTEFWSVQRKWPGETVFIIAGGPSVTQEQVDKLKGRRVIAIKLSVEKCPWADVLFFADGKWVKPHKEIIRSFVGQVVTVAPLPDDCVKSVKRLQKLPPDTKTPLTLQTDPKALAVRRTSLTGAMNLAFHLSGGPQVLLGADGKLGAKGRTHHHTPHDMPHKSIAAVFDEQRQDLNTIAADLKARGVAVYNTNPESSFRMFPFLDLDAALAL